MDHRGNYVVYVKVLHIHICNAITTIIYHPGHKPASIVAAALNSSAITFLTRPYKAKVSTSETQNEKIQEQ